MRVEVKLESGGGEIRLTIQDDDRCLAAALPEAWQAARPAPLGMIGMRAPGPGECVLIEGRVPLSGPAVGHTE
jgi:hypothetical protein